MEEEIKVSELIEVSSVDENDYVMIIQNQANKKAKVSKIKSNISEAMQELMKPRYIVATTTTFSELSSDFQILLNSIERSEGNAFTLSNNKIVVGAGVSKIRVSGSIFVDMPQGTGYVWGKIVRSNSSSIDWINTSIAPYANAGGFLSASIPASIISVQEGDVIALIADSTCGGKSRTGASNTWLLVEAIE